MVIFLMFFPDFNVDRTLHTMTNRRLPNYEHPFSEYLHGTVMNPGLLISVTYYMLFFVFESVINIYIFFLHLMGIL